jgi:hypothetical protein
MSSSQRIVGCEARKDAATYVTERVLRRAGPALADLQAGADDKVHQASGKEEEKRINGRILACIAQSRHHPPRTANGDDVAAFQAFENRNEREGSMFLQSHGCV